jgi:hypothetical protein
MFNNLFSKLKINLLYLKNNLLFFFRLIKFTFLINIFYFIITYNCLVQTNNSIFLYNFINDIFFYINLNYSLFLFLVFYYTLSIKSLLFKKFQNIANPSKNKFLIANTVNKKNFNNLLLSFNYYMVNLESIKSILNYVYSLYIFYIKYS